MQFDQLTSLEQTGHVHFIAYFNAEKIVTFRLSVSSKQVSKANKTERCFGTQYLIIMI